MTQPNQSFFITSCFTPLCIIVLFSVVGCGGPLSDSDAPSNSSSSSTSSSSTSSSSSSGISDPTSVDTLYIMTNGSPYCPHSQASFNTDQTQINMDDFAGSTLYLSDHLAWHSRPDSLELTITYSNGTNNALPMSISATTDLTSNSDTRVIDGVVFTELPFPPTGDWNTLATLTYPLPDFMLSGINKFRFRSLTDTGGPNIKDVGYSIPFTQSSGYWSSNIQNYPCTENPLPIAQISIPTIENSNSISKTTIQLLVDKEVIFSSDNSYSPTGSIDSFEWDFGNGYTSSEPNPSYTFRDVGSYRVQLKVMDNFGNHQITVKDLVVSLPD